MPRPTFLMKADLLVTAARCVKAAALLPSAVKAIKRNQAGYPTGQGDGRSSGISDLSSKLDDNGNLIDPVGRELARLDQLCKRIRAEITEAEDIVTRATRTPTTAEREKVASGDADPGCEICARFKRNDHSIYELTHVEASDVKGNLQRPYRLCRFCYQFVLDTGRLPTKPETEAHAAGKRVYRTTKG